MTKFYFILSLLLCLITSGFSDEVNSLGTVIVTYQTDDQLERLDRVRFWIRNDLYEQQMFPKGKAFVDDPEEGSRMVVIEGLPIGEYELEFVVPNGDGYFEKTPIKRFTLNSDDAIRVEQLIKKKEF